MNLIQAFPVDAFDVEEISSVLCEGVGDALERLLSFSGILEYFVDIDWSSYFRFVVNNSLFGF